MTPTQSRWYRHGQEVERERIAHLLFREMMTSDVTVQEITRLRKMYDLVTKTEFYED